MKEKIESRFIIFFTAFIALFCVLCLGAKPVLADDDVDYDDIIEDIDGGYSNEIAVIDDIEESKDSGPEPQSVTIGGFTYERILNAEKDTRLNYLWTVTDFNGSTKNAVIYDTITYSGTGDPEISENTTGEIISAWNQNISSVAFIKEEVFEEMGKAGVETLQLPSSLLGTSGEMDGNKIVAEGIPASSLLQLTNLKAFSSNVSEDYFDDENISYTPAYFVYCGVLYVIADDGTTILISYPQKKTGDYIILNGTNYIDNYALRNAVISSLTIFKDLDIPDALYEDTFSYPFYSASVDYYKGDNCTDGSIIINGELIAYGNKATTDLSNITSACPYAFYSEDILKSAMSTIPEEVLETTPFTFYSGYYENSDFAVRYFNVNGMSAYCYNYGATVPVSVSSYTDYDSTNFSDEEKHAVKAILFAGYPNDAYGFLKATGVDEEAAKNITGTLIWNTVSKTNLGLDSIYGITSGKEKAAQDYWNSIENKVSEITDAEMANFKVGYYAPVESGTQGLIAVVAAAVPVEPEPEEKPSVSISKKDATTGEELPGATLRVEKDGTVIDEWVSTKTPHIIEDLEDGTYTLTEITAPDGYLTAESITFTVTDGVVSSETVVMYDEAVPEETQPDKPTTVEPEPEEKPSVSISKKDATTGEELPGATLRVEKDGTVIDEWVSTKTPHIIEDLEDGTYTLTEITAPDGYLTAESITFTVTDGVVSSETVVMYDETVKVYISKQDITTKEELPGATLTVTNEAGETVDEWISATEPHIIERLADGTYTLTEVTAPSGYDKSESITFEIKNGIPSSETVIMYDSETVVKNSGETRPTNVTTNTHTTAEETEEEEDIPDVTVIDADIENPSVPEKETTIDTPREPVKTGDAADSVFVLLMVMIIALVPFLKKSFK